MLKIRAGRILGKSAAIHNPGFRTQKLTVQKVFLTLTFSVMVIMGNAQIVDVYQNKTHQTSTRVFTEEVDKDYAPGKLEILQDKNQSEIETWTSVETQLKGIALQTVNSGSDFFLIYSAAQRKVEQANERQRLKRDFDPYERSPSNFDFVSIEISLLSVVNNYGTYVINYFFEVRLEGQNHSSTMPVSKMYLADYQRGTVREIGDKPTRAQQKVLESHTLSKFKKLYLLQTRKLDLTQVDRIRNVELKDSFDFSRHIHFSEAIVFPFFSGLMVAFPALSASSKSFNGMGFRIFLNAHEIDGIIAAFPEFKRVFNRQLNPPSPKVIQQLNNNDNFDLRYFQIPPKDNKALDLLNLDNRIYSVEILIYDQTDTVKTHRGSTRYFYNSAGNIERMERKDASGKIYNDERFTYNDDGQIIVEQRISDRGELKLFHYHEGVLNYAEHIRLDVDFRQHQTFVDLMVQQDHFVYTDDYKYEQKINMVGDERDFYQNSYSTTYRWVQPDRYCNQHHCILIDDEKRIIGVQQNRNSLITVLTDEKGRPLESYFDNDRYRYFFSYNAEGRLQKFEAFDSGRSTRTLEYRYSDNPLAPLEILDSKSPRYQVFRVVYK
ncbi:MAG: hypothetical protein JJU02_10650 [Cryomorphaceae bacterium]|nr:hypothetical protein [Cryomorphaceae bacterium]